MRQYRPRSDKPEWRCRLLCPLPLSKSRCKEVGQLGSSSRGRAERADGSLGTFTLARGVRLMKSVSIVLFLLAACDLALAKEVPLPRAKPLSSRAAHPPSAAPVPEVLPLYDAEAWPSDCALRLAE